MNPTYIELTHLAVLEFLGDDACTFLQGQLSSDIRALNSQNQCQLSTYSTPKGRMLASFLAWQPAPNVVRLLVAADLAEATLKRLSMFILRSKVTARRADELTILGGLSLDLPPDAPVPPDDWTIRPYQHAHILRIPQQRCLIVGTADTCASWPRQHNTDHAHSQWIQADIAAGIPWVTLATRELFVPQMCNFELIGNGVSFKKGCYTGQEIVARSQYLGQVKRRMLPARVACASVAVGTALSLAHDDTQTIGHIVLSAPRDDKYSDVLASFKIQHLNDGVCIHTTEGNIPLEFGTLPYTLPEH